ncbi:hypothetical protein GOX2734 (plasmid) [Gluconobacter oxydans 621H]|uniref:Uncharacterized protein n=1 Tax=Gluconobacter oxydans (strain 621H) TaxID=290633 RepID=Q5HXF7_GLUOX|nr:hypothetical protein GOX2734 [Gluconobacter oxydans 621H]
MTALLQCLPTARHTGCHRTGASAARERRRPPKASGRAASGSLRETLGRTPEEGTNESLCKCALRE